MNIKKLHKVLLNFNFIVVVSFAFLICGCSTPKDVAYFQDVSEEIYNLPVSQPIKIEPNDKLSIMVKTMDPTLSALFNLQVYAEGSNEIIPYTMGAGNLLSGGAMSAGVSKYTVTEDGMIDFPVLGMIKVVGMTRNELAAFIKGELMGRELAKDPVVTVEFINMGISVLGEVARPGRYDINQDQINLIEALSMAGDLTLLGKRENIMVLRETPEGAKTYRVDLTNFKELSASPAYYLKQGDVIYVEPNDLKKRQTTTNGNNVLSTGFWISVASLLTSVVTTIAVFIR